MNVKITFKDNNSIHFDDIADIKIASNLLWIIPDKDSCLRYSYEKKDLAEVRIYLL